MSWPVLLRSTTNSSPVIFISDRAKVGGTDGTGGDVNERARPAVKNPAKTISNIITKYFFISSIIAVVLSRESAGANNGGLIFTRLYLG